MNNLVLAGGGGHCSSCIDVIESEGKYKIRGIVQPNEASSVGLLGYPVIGQDKDLPNLISDGSHVLITVGQIKSPDTRVNLYKFLKSIDAILPVIISPKSYVSAHANLEKGSIVMHGAVINAGAYVSKNCIINSQALLEHDVSIGSHTHISTGTKINGGVKVGKGCFIGSGTIIREGLEIGEGSLIGAGQVILDNVPKGSFLKSL